MLGIINAIMEAKMKTTLIISAATLALLVAGPAFPRQEQEKEKPQEQQKQEERQQEQKQQKQTNKQQQQQQQEKQKQQADKQQKQQQKQSQQAAKQQQQQEKQQQAEKQQQKDKQQADKQQQDQQKRQQQLAKQQQQDEKERQKQQQQLAKQQAQSDVRDHRDSGDHRGRRVSDTEFRAHFGREHTFHVTRSDDRHFWFGGYSFEFVNAWPAGWLYTDDFYIEDVDGQYYLIDLFHPEVRVLVVIV